MLKDLWRQLCKATRDGYLVVPAAISLQLNKEQYSCKIITPRSYNFPKNKDLLSFTEMKSKAICARFKLSTLDL